MKQNDTARACRVSINERKKKLRNNTEWVGLKAGLINYIRNPVLPN